MEKEIWKDIKGYEGKYQVSNTGKVKSLNYHREKREKLLKQILSKYFRVPLHKNSKKEFLSIHRLIALAFIPNPENKPCINHLNGIKTDNRIENLEWCTYSENCNHAIKNELYNTPKGEQHCFSKLKEKDVLLIRELKKEGYTDIILAKQFNVTRGAIYSIVTYKNWKHI